MDNKTPTLTNKDGCDSASSGDGSSRKGAYISPFFFNSL